VSLDTWSLIAIAVFALLGLLRGAARQLASIAALLCAVVASRPLSEAIGPWWASKQPNLPPLIAVALSFVISFVILCSLAYALVFLSLRPKYKTPNNPHSRLGPLGNRSLGLCLGGLKGALLVWLLLSMAVLLPQKLSWLPFALPWEFEGSHAYAFVRKHNALNLAHWKKLLALGKMAELPPYAAQLLPTPQPGLSPQPLSQELDKLKKLFENPEIRYAFEKRQFQSLLKNKELDALLSNPTILKTLESFRHLPIPTAPPEPPPPLP